MLIQARDFNEENNIAGCLLYYQGEFLQYLEGNEVVIINLFDKIKEDERHYEVKLISYDYIPQRIFENWDMGYEDFHGTNHQLEYLKLYVSLFLEVPAKSLADNCTSKSFWDMVKKLLYQESIDR